MQNRADSLTPIFRDGAGILADWVLADTFVILTTTYTTDSRGGKTPTTTASSPIRCLLVPTTSVGRESQVVGVTVASTPFTLMVPRGTQLAMKNRVRVNGTREFEVVRVSDGGNWEMLMSVGLEEVETRG